MKLDKIFGALVPKDRKFYPLFKESADNLVVAAELLIKLFNSNDAEGRIALVKQIKEVERKGDDITKKLVTALNNTFITPFDREDVHELTERLDNVVDHIHAASKRIRLYKLETFPKEFTSIAKKIHEATLEIQKVLSNIHNANDFVKHYGSINRIDEIETEVDDIYQEYLAGLFDTEINAIELIKKRDVLVSLEKAVDACDDVAGVFSTLSVKLG